MNERMKWWMNEWMNKMFYVPFNAFLVYIVTVNLRMDETKDGSESIQTYVSQSDVSWPAMLTTKPQIHSI